MLHMDSQFPSRTDVRGLKSSPKLRVLSYGLALATMAPVQAMRDDLLSTLFARHAGPGNRPCRVRDDTMCLYTILVLACMSGWRKDGHQSVTMLKGIANLPFFPFLFCSFPVRCYQRQIRSKKQK